MPGYGTLPEDEGRGLLPWSWAEERLASSHDYWLATVSEDGTAHLMPVWALWHEGRLWFSSSNGSRKARNLRARPRCTVSTDNPLEPVVVQGTDYGADMVDPASNSVFALRPAWVFALDSADFTGTPTRFIFAQDRA